MERWKRQAINIKILLFHQNEEAEKKRRKKGGNRSKQKKISSFHCVCMRGKLFIFHLTVRNLFFNAYLIGNCLQFRIKCSFPIFNRIHICMGWQILSILFFSTHKGTQIYNALLCWQYTCHSEWRRLAICVKLFNKIMWKRCRWM
jgi:hypothetical protein